MELPSRGDDERFRPAVNMFEEVDATIELVITLFHARADGTTGPAAIVAQETLHDRRRENMAGVTMVGANETQ